MDVIKRCSQCTMGCLKTNFHRNILTKTDYRSACKNCEKKIT